MQIKFLRILSLLVTLVSASAVSAPYDDEHGHPAPNTVRRAAEELEAAWDIYRTSHGKPEYIDCACAVLLCGNEICCCGTRMINPEYKNPRPKKDIEELRFPAPNNSVVKMTRKSFDDALNELKDAVNSNVVKPLAYERDLRIDLHWTMWTDGAYRLDQPLEETVMTVVNGLGGWVNQDN